ncbi:MAG: Scr1 family TA system antitoxin-like transcriptional regulator, partial [Actinomycetota bacterium]|nr:Scr1 family TA system antitoxin-like transcriptional regulator [Actinomycetota bacterium]
VDIFRHIGLHEAQHVALLESVHGAMRGTFTILDFADPQDPPLVYLESLVGSYYVERAEHLAAYRRAFDRIRAQAVPLEEYLG